MFKKIITYFLILAVVLPIFATVIPFGGEVKIAYAKTESERKKELITPCGWIAGIFSGSFQDCIMFTGVYLLYEVGVNGAIWVTGLVSDLFNISIQFSLTGASFDAEKNIMIKDGWALVRDLLNLVFIFILLYAAISTILQYGNMDIKKILPGLIVAALLVNFSLMISKVVIDASHIFAWEFYNQIDSTKKGEFATLKDSAEFAGDFVKKDLAGVFFAGFNPQRLLTGTPMKKNGEVVSDVTADGSNDGVETVSAWKSLQSKASMSGESLTDTLWRMAIIIMLEIGLAFFASFILFAASIMFIIRVVILWLIMIFSPIAFLGMILPSMSKYSKRWWDNLIDQAFFAPAFLFMFMLVTKFVNAKLIDDLLHITPNDTSRVVTGLNMGEILSIVFNFIVVSVLLLACLIIAKQMGGKSAELGMAWAHKGKNMALGGANKMLWKPARYGLRYGGGAAGDSGWWSNSIGRIPGGNIIGRKLGAMKKADEDKTRKSAEKHAGTLSSSGRASLERDIKDKGFLKRFMYTGPEGAFKSGKEGYESIIEKKKAEGEERGRIADKMIELMGDKFKEFAGGLKESEAKDKIKAILIRGNLEELDKYTEAEDKAVETKRKIELDSKNEEKINLENDIKRINDKLTEIRKDGKDEKSVMEELMEKQKGLDIKNKEVIGILAKKEHRENIQKGVDRYAGKQASRSGKPEEKKEDKKSK